MPYVSIFGSVGSGKSLFLVLMALLTKLNIVANFTFTEKFPKKWESFSIDKFINAKYENCVILLDEIYIYLESRLSHDELHLLMSYILFQSRKLNVTIYGSAQLLSTIDKRFRSEVMNDSYVLCEGIYNGYDNLGKKVLVAIQYKIFDKSGKLLQTLIYTTQQIQFLFQYYKTEEIIQRKDKINSNYQIGVDRKTNNELFAEQIMQKYEGIGKITLNRVALYCRENDIPEFLIKDIFTTIQDKIALEKKKKEKS